MLEERPMKKLTGHTRKDEKGFTLIELVVVIAILGVMAAIAVPMVNNFLSSSKEQAYIADRETIQAAVSGYYSSPGNERFEGRRQYPIIGANKTGALVNPDGNGSPDEITAPIEGNPLQGTKGGTPTWFDTDTADGVRDLATENILNDADTAFDAVGWHVVIETKGETDYLVDTRDYFIDFDRLVTIGLLEKVPGSVSPDNTGDSTTPGSYSWYVDQNGRVQSLLFFYPVSANPEDTGYQEVYP